MYNQLTISNKNIENKLACFRVSEAPTSVKEMEAEVKRVTVYKDADSVVSFLGLFTSLLKGIPALMIKQI